MTAAVGLSVGLAVIGCVVLAIALLMVVIRWRRRWQQLNSASAANAVQPEMEWDNSAFNITVNPIGVENYGDDEDIELGGRVILAADDVEDEIAAGSELEETDEPAANSKMATAACKDLEWDDSTLSY